MLLVGCGTSGTTSASSFRDAIGAGLPGAQGKTLADQERIDDTVAGGCAIEFYRPSECDLHTTASAERRRELAPNRAPTTGGRDLTN